MKLKKIREYLYNDEIDIYQRSFVMNLMSVITILFITTLELIFMHQMWREVFSTFIAVLIMGVVGFFSLKKRKPEIGAFLIALFMCFIFFPVTFINGGGIKGVGTVWFIFNMFLINVLLKGKKRLVFYILEEIVCVGCFVLVYIHPDITPVYSGVIAYVYLFTTIFLICNAIMLMLTFENNLYINANDKTKKQNEEIEALYASQNRFFSSMSHEIRTPINTIIGLNEMILRENISDEIAEDAINIRSASKMLLNTINDILDMSKFQAGDMRLLIETYSTGDMLSELVGMLWLKAKEKNLDLRVTVAPDIPAELRGDEVRIKQILMNILNNAIKYTKEGSVSLSVECEKREDGIYNMIYTVEDTGMGIKKEDIPYLFSAFRRVDENNTKHIEGTGLGLSIVKQFLKLMDGKVTVNSVYTKGSTFIIEIPQKAASEKELGEYDYNEHHKFKTRSVYKQKFEAPKAKLLVVDDNESNLMVVKKLLRDTKVQIDAVKSGREALTKTLETKYHIIFMDHLMPEMDGIECSRSIRKQTGGLNKETNIIILTANAGEENRLLYAKEGFNGHIVKPVTGEILENEVYRYLPKDLVTIKDESDEIVDETVLWMKDTVRKKKIAVTTESIADIPEVLIKKYDIGIIPHKVITTEGTIFKEGVEIDTKGVMDYMKDKNHLMMPLAPSLEETEAFYAQQLTQANNIIHICISPKIINSGYDIAVSAANSFDNVTVVDSGHLSSGQGILVLSACRMAVAGMNVDEILAKLEIMKKRIRTSFIVDSMEYLARSKQVSERRATLIDVLMVRPTIVMKNGAMVQGGIKFGSREKAWKNYIDSILSEGRIDKTIMIVTYVGLTQKEQDWIRRRIERRIKLDNLFFQEANPAIAANCGPGTYGLIYVREA